MACISVCNACKGVIISLFLLDPISYKGRVSVSLLLLNQFIVQLHVLHDADISVSVCVCLSVLQFFFCPIIDLSCY